ncbi:MAG: VCBS repeat-containing protein, partial [Pseudomonadota bacterium]
MRPELALALLLAAAPAQAEVRFKPVEMPPHSYAGGWEHFVGGGLAVFDCDEDGRPELYAAGGSNSAQLFRNTSKTDVSFVAETPLALDITGVTGAYPLDIDGDGILDLAVLRVGEDRLIKGLGDCAFAPFEGLSFEAAGDWTTAFSATWETAQSLPTLAFGTYVDRSNPDGPFEACDTSLLYRPDGMRYKTPLALEPGYCVLSMLFSDWNRSGRADLRLSNDRHYFVRGGSEQMWAMEPTPRLYGATDGWSEFAIWGMGIASRDLTGDGFPEVYLTSMGDQKLQVFDGAANRPVWRDVTYDFGTTAHRPHVGSDGRPSTGWHAQFADLNNDGRDDIFVTKGNVEQMPVAAMEDPNSLLLQQEDGRFVESSVPAGLASMARGRGGAVADFNRDGWLDVAVVNRRAPIEVYQNAGGDAQWLSV